MDIKDRLKYVRESKQLSQSALAEKLCKSTEYVNAIETGVEELKPLVFLNFCKVLEVSPFDILKD